MSFPKPRTLILQTQNLQSKHNCKRLRTPPRQPGRPTDRKGGKRVSENGLKSPRGSQKKTKFVLFGAPPSIGAADRRDPHGIGLQLLQATWAGVPQGGGGGPSQNSAWINRQEAEANSTYPELRLGPLTFQRRIEVRTLPCPFISFVGICPGVC